MTKENPEGVSWTNNPSFPLKANDSEPEGEAWVGRSPLPRYPEGVAYHPVQMRFARSTLAGAFIDSSDSSDQSDPSDLSDVSGGDQRKPRRGFMA